VRPLLAAITLRPLAAPLKTDAYDLLIKHAGLAVVELEGLKGEDLRALLCDALKVDEVPAEVLRMIGEKSYGNPFWVKEFAKSMLEDQILTTSGGACQVRWIAV
jgi:predicted ATPase